METTTSDLYSILGIPKNADFITIRKAYLKLALKYHPDKNKDKDATMNFHSISNAYEILSNPEKREKYDKFGIVHEVEITEVPEEEILKKYENLNNMINREFQNERCAKITLILFVVAFSALFALAIYDLSNLESIGFISLGEVSFIIFGGIVYVAFIKVFDEYLKLTRNKLFESDKTKETNIINKIFSSPFEEYPLVFLVFFHSLQIALLPYRFSVLFVTRFIEKKNE